MLLYAGYACWQADRLALFFVSVQCPDGGWGEECRCIWAVFKVYLTRQGDCRYGNNGYGKRVINCREVEAEYDGHWVLFDHRDFPPEEDTGYVVAYGESTSYERMDTQR
jgi:hypothetical protein